MALAFLVGTACDYFPDHLLSGDAQIPDTGGETNIDGPVDGPFHGPDSDLQPDSSQDSDTSAPCGYLYRRSITIAAKQVGLNNAGTLPATGFPVVVKLSGEWLKTTTVDPASGRIASAKGHDITFRREDGTTSLDHEIEAYDGVKGTLTAWVRIDSLSKATATTIYLYHGNPCITAATQNTSAVWDASYKGVWHLNEEAAGTGTKDVYRDSTSHANHGDDHASATGQGGQMAGGQEFDGVDDVVDCEADKSLNIKQKLTLSAWIRIPSRPAKDKWFTVMAKEKWKFLMYLYGTSATTTNLGGWFELDTGKVDIFKKSGLDIDVAPNTWTQVAIAFDGKQFQLYVNGTLDHVESKTGVIKDSSADKMVLGLKESLYFKGHMDEARISDIDRSGDWIVTSYRNQKNPGNHGSPGFYTVGAEGPTKP